MDEHTATIERLTRERDAAQKRVENLERAITNTPVVAEGIPMEACAAYLNARGWTMVGAAAWRHPEFSLTFIMSAPSIVVRRMVDAENRAAALIVADLLDYADAPR